MELKRAISGTVLALLVCGAGYGQAAEEPLEFEVASVKLAPPRKPGEPQGMMGCFGGPGSKDPGRFTCAKASVSAMVRYAYNMKPYQLRPPYSSDEIQFNVEAKVPRGTSREQVGAMLRNLLVERFKLTFHRETREVQGYAVVVAKSGLKMKESAVEDPPASADAGPVRDADGFSYFARRNAMAVGYANGLARWVGMNIPVDGEANAGRLTGLLNSLTGVPVVDATGLKGKYDFTFTFSPDAAGFASGPAPAPPVPGEGGMAPPDDGGMTIFAALEKDLGLKLEPRKIMVDLFVIDHADKTPVEN
jgi:uncharacterized protein (TIGR03435 family)